MMSFGSGIEFFSWVWLLLFWGGVIALAIWLIRLLFPATAARHDKKNNEAPSIAETLQKRYARGGLTTEQYHELMQTIRK